MTCRCLVLVCACPLAGRRALFFFFCQAEDGIRYLTVTGVQTCALPISGRQEPPLRPAVLLACDHDTFKMGAGQRLHNRVRARLARRSGRWLDSEPMATERKDRRKKPDRRSSADRRTKQAPVEVELRKGERRRTKLTRRLELETAADQIHAALGLLTYAQDQGLLLDVDRWLLGTAIARLRVAMEQLGEGTGDAV